MQRRLAALGASALAAVLVGSASATPPVAQYVWAQPGAARVDNQGAQPPSWIPITSGTFVLVAPAYHWAQPWGWSPGTESAQPVP